MIASALVDGMYDDSEERRLAAEVGEALPERVSLDDDAQGGSRCCDA